MKRITAALLALIVALGVTNFGSIEPSHAAAGEPVDVALTASRSSNGANTKKGDTFTITYTLTNTGTETYAPITRTHIFTSRNVAVVSITNGLQCPSTQLIDKVQYQWMSIFTPNQQIITCHGSTETSLFSPLNPGQALSFTVTFKALADFPAGSTFIAAVNRPTNSGEGPQEGEESEAYYINWDWNVYQNGIYTWSTSWTGNNHVFFAYNTDPPADPVAEEGTVTTTTGSKTADGAQTQPTVGGVTQSGQPAQVSDGTSNEVGGTLNGDNLTAESETDSNTSPKAEVALDLRNALPDRISREDPNAWEALVSGEYKNELIAAFSVLTLLGAAFLIVRKRYLKKVDGEKEYRRSLKIKTLHFQKQSAKGSEAVAEKTSN